MWWEVVCMCIVAYLLGSVPSAYLVGKWFRGVDIREHGSGSVGGSNAWHVIGHWSVVPVGLFDVAKAAGPVWVTFDTLDLGRAAAFAVGLCAMAGHAWSLYLHFTGGRALSCALGTLLVLFPQGLVLQASLMIVGLLIHAEGLLAWLGLIMLPVMSVASAQPAATTWGCVAMALLTALKRLEANGRPVPEGQERWRVLARRLWFDRDTAGRRQWGT
ncbi:MAG: glycerol-3-phosphate acyltransferase [Coriobacteriales bacterium]|nr:glycerol-3-phosphate acyltransferase [Actinomycetes bacterium]